MSLNIREGSLVELRGSKDDWQVVGQKHDGLVLKYVIKSTYFELNQYLFEQTFNNEPLFDELNDLPKEDSDFVSTLSQVEQLADPGIATLLKQTVKQEPALSPNADQTIPPSDKVSLIHDPIKSDTSSNPPKKRFKAANKENVDEVLSHNNEVSTKRSTKWPVSTLKGMFSLSFLILFYSLQLNETSI